MSRTVQAFTLALIAVLSGACGLAAEPIRLGQVNLSFYAVTGGVVQEILERSGQDFSVIEGSHGEIYPKLGPVRSIYLPRPGFPTLMEGCSSKFATRALCSQNFMMRRAYTWQCRTMRPSD